MSWALVLAASLGQAPSAPSSFSPVGWLMGLVGLLFTGGILATWRAQSGRLDALEARELDRAKSDGGLAAQVQALTERTKRIEEKLDRVLERPK